VKPLVAVLALAAALFGAAGGGALLLERRLAALAPGGVTFGTLHYNPFTGSLALTDVRARDAAGRDVFTADSVLARANAVSLLGGALSLGRVRVAAPRLTLRADAGFALDDVAAGLGAAHAFLGSAGALALPLRVEDLLIGDGVVTIEGAGEGGAPLVVRDLDVRLSRLTTAALDDRDVAFAVEMAVYGTPVHVTGQPRAGGYAVHVRARGLDVARLARDVPAAVLQSVERGLAEIDADLLLVGGRVLASGFVRLTDAVLALPIAGRPRLRAASVAVAADAFDVASGVGRITRLDLGAPSLALPAAGLREMVEPLRSDSDLVLRRISITDGTLMLDGPGGVQLMRVQLAAQLPERRSDSGWMVSARAALGDDAAISVDGLVARDLRGLDAVTRLVRVPLAPWRALTSTPPGWNARVSFDGRLRLIAREGETLASATGQAELTDVSGPASGGFRADRVALGIRRLRWPAGEAVFDRVVVVDGEVRGDAPGRALHRLAVDLAPDANGSLARLKLSASTEAGGRVDLDRVLPYGATDVGLPLAFIAMTLDEASRSASIPPSALPAAALP